jgi:hypothetical protein
MSSEMRALPESASRLLEVFLSSRMAIATKIGLALVAEGMSYREAAEATGCGDFADLYRAAMRYRLIAFQRVQAKSAPIN